MADRVSSIPTPEGLPPLTVGLCSLRQRLASPLVKSLWDVAEQTYGSGV
jgi:LysR family positive regulator for ilvC